MRLEIAQRWWDAIHAPGEVLSTEFFYVEVAQNPGGDLVCPPQTCVARLGGPVPAKATAIHPAPVCLPVSLSTPLEPRHGSLSFGTGLAVTRARSDNDMGLVSRGPLSLAAGSAS